VAHWAHQIPSDEEVLEFPEQARKGNQQYRIRHLHSEAHRSQCPRSARGPPGGHYHNYEQKEVF